MTPSENLTQREPIARQPAEQRHPVYHFRAWLAARAEILAATQAAEPRPVLLVGAPGTGKSALLVDIAAELGDAGALAATLAAIPSRSGPDNADPPPVLLVDDADRLDGAALARFAGQPCVLVGKPDFAARIATELGAATVRLGGVAPDEVGAYLRAALAQPGQALLPMTPAAIAVLNTETDGLPRLLTAVGRTATYLAKYADAEAVDPDHVRAALASRSALRLQTPPPTLPTKPASPKPQPAKPPLAKPAAPPPPPATSPPATSPPATSPPATSPPANRPPKPDRPPAGRRATDATASGSAPARPPQPAQTDTAGETAVQPRRTAKLAMLPPALIGLAVVAFVVWALLPSTPGEGPRVPLPLLSRPVASVPPQASNQPQPFPPSRASPPRPVIASAPPAASSSATSPAVPPIPARPAPPAPASLAASAPPPPVSAPAPVPAKPPPPQVALVSPPPPASPPASPPAPARATPPAAAKPPAVVAPSPQAALPPPPAPARLPPPPPSPPMKRLDVGVLPVGAATFVELRYPAGNAEAKSQADRLAEGLSAGGLLVGLPRKYPPATAGRGVGYFYAVDQAAAASVGRALGQLGSAPSGPPVRLDMPAASLPVQD